MRKGFLLKSFSLLMTLIMLVVCIPAAGAQAIADEIAERKALAEAEEVSLEEAASYDDSETTEYEIIEEVVEKRTENQKEFLLSDGSFLVAVYGNAVHYEQSGEWVDIDNTLVFEAGEKKTEQPVEEEAEISEEIETLQPSDGIDIEAEKPDSESETAEEQELGQSALQGEVDTATAEPTRNAAKEETLETDELVTSADEFSGYKNTANTFEVKFASDLSQGVLYNVTEGKYSITMSLAEKPDSNGNAILLGQSIQPLQTNKEESVELEKTTAGVEYGEVYDDVDIQYSLSGSSIKEDIIIKSPDASSSYTFRFVVEGLKVEQFEETYISFIDENTGEELYFIPQPFAYDNYGQILFDSWQTLEDKGNGVYELTIAIDEEYMDEEVCAFPITVDPILVKAASVYYGTMSGYKVGWANEAYPTNVWNNPQTMVAGNLRIGGVNGDIRRLRTHFQWNLPTLEDGATIVNSKLRVCLAFSYNYLNTAYNLPVNAYTMDRSWNATGMTWNNHPLPHRTNNDFIEGILTPIDTKNFYCSGGAVESNHYAEASFDITQAVQGWYQGTEVNNGIVFAGAEESNNTHASYAVFYSPYVISTYVSEFPYFTLNYRTAVGTESYWDTYAHTPGASMAGNVNLHNGSLSLTTSIFNDRVLRMPFSYSYTYNSIKTNDNYGATPYAGKGWITNISQKLTKVTDTAYTSLGYKYIYMDADGTEHWFYTYNNKIVDEDGLNLTVLESNPTYYILETKAKDRLYFRRSDGVLSHYEGFNDENSTQLSYTSGPAVRITAPGNRVSDVYKSTTSNYISSFVDPMGYTSLFTVTSDRLTEITLGASKSSAVLNYEYHPVNGLLTRVTDSLGNKTEYTYNSRKQVIELKQFAMNTATSAYVLVNNVQFDYSATNQTVVRGWGADEIMGNSDDILTTYIFDGFGSTINVHTTSADKKTMYSASSYQYTEHKSANPSANPNQSNRIKLAASTNGFSENLLKNPMGIGDSNNIAGWSSTVWEGTEPYFNVNPNGGYSYSGNNGILIHAPINDQYTLGAEQTIILEPGVYTLSSYVLVEHSNYFPAYGITGNYGAVLGVRMGEEIFYSQFMNEKRLDSGGMIDGFLGYDFPYDHSIENNMLMDGYRRLSLTFTVDAESPQSVDIGLLTKNGYGVVYFSDIQLEKGAEISDYNTIQNASFEEYETNNGTAYWPTEWSIPSGAHNVYTTTIQDAIFGNSVLHIGSTNKNPNRAPYCMPQTGAKPGMVYMLGGWAKGQPSASGAFGLKATVTYKNGSVTKTSTHFAEYNKYYTDWQYTCIPIVIEDMGIGYNVWSIKIELIFEGMSSSAYFDGISLIRDAGNSYTYDSKGSLVSTTDYNNRTVGIIYDQVTNLPTKYVDAKGNEYLYEYDSDRNLVGTTTPLGVITATDYNDYGQAIAGTIIPIGGDATGENSIHNYNEYSTDGNFLVGATNSRGYSSSTEYNTTTGLVELVTDVSGHTTEYDYNPNGFLNETTFLANGTTLTIEMDYNNRNQLNFYSNGNTDYNISYTPQGQYGSFWIGNLNNSNSRQMIENEYTETGSRLLSSTYGNGDVLVPVYDELGRVVGIEYNDVLMYKSSFDKNGNLSGVQDFNTGLSWSYTYSLTGGLIAYSNSEGNSAGKITNILGQTITTEHNVYGVEISNSFSYNADGQPERYSSSTMLGDELENLFSAPLQISLYEYDNLGRLSTTETQTIDVLGMLMTGQGVSASIQTNYSYAQGARLGTNGQVIQGGGQTTLIDGAEYTLNDSLTPFDGFQYEYDVLGNITQIERYNKNSSSYELVATYVYDDLGQLIRENDQANGRTILYSYDVFGNITSEKRYAYTTAATPTVVQLQKTWGYGDSVWGDLLTSFNGTSITYDTIGNPLNYYNGMTFEWGNGRQLTGLNSGTLSASYVYDYTGMRYSKIVNRNGSVTSSKYFYDGGNLIAEQRDNDKLYFHYDAMGQLFAFDYIAYGSLSTRYYYLRSPNGDIVGILDANGTVVVSYAYDAWGNTLSVSGSMASTIGAINPFRYKGYYYDAESGFYYLQTRYYDPVTHRFLNADGYASTGQGFIGNNMFSYCLNNPVNMADPSGRAAVLVIKKLASATKKKAVASTNICTCSDCLYGANGRLSAQREGSAPTKANNNWAVVFDGTPSNGQILVNLGGMSNSKTPSFKIVDSWQVTDREDMKAILKVVMDTTVVSTAMENGSYTRTEEDMIIEWEAHNYAYDQGILKGRAESVDIDEGGYLGMYSTMAYYYRNPNQASPYDSLLDYPMG